jgi:hypothetical protein
MDFRAPLPSSSTDHIANIVSESQAWKIDCRHHQLTPSASRCQPSVRINSAPLVNRPVVLLVLERAGNWKKVREQVLEYGLQLEETYKYV